MTDILCLVLETLDPDPAKAKAKLVVLVAAGLIDQGVLARVKRDSQIYRLRSRMTTPALALRFSLTQRQVFAILERQRVRIRAVRSLTAFDGVK